MRLGFEEYGQHNETSIIFLHGLGVSGWMWKPAVEQLTKYHCIIPDLPEHRQSINVGEFTINSCAEQIADLIKKKAHHGRAHVVGLSLGGQIALQMLSIVPESIISTVVSGVPIKPFLGTKLLPLYLKLTAPFQFYDVFLRSNLKRKGIPHQYFNEFKKDSLLLSGKPLYRILKESTAFRLPKEAMPSNIAILSLVGENEPHFIMNSCREIGESFRFCQAYSVKDAGHNWPLQAPGLFAKTITLFIRNKKMPSELHRL